ncbi:hypothetical protein ACTNBM_11865 [Lachnospiraceae bacterium HCP1S3_C3]
MTFECRLEDVEEKMAETDTFDVPDDIAETDDNYQLVISGWYVKIPSLNLYLRAGVMCLWDEDEKVYMPDFDVTVIYEDENELSSYLYYEQDGFVVTVNNWLHGQLDYEEISQLMCEVVVERENEH